MSSDINRTSAERKTYELAPTDVPFTRYWLEGALLIVSVLTPVFVLLWYRSPDLFERSGALMVFFAAVAEFVTLNRSNKKHLLNACRAKAGEMPYDFSIASKVTGWLSFLFALAGTLIWAYGTKFYGA